MPLSDTAKAAIGVTIAGLTLSTGMLLLLLGAAVVAVGFLAWIVLSIFAGFIFH